MENAAIRQKLHDYIDTADERKLEAMFVILQTDIEHGPQYSDATITMLHARRDNHLNGSSKSYSVAETLASSRGKKNNMTCQVVIKAEAQADVVAAYNFYEEKQASLGEEFLAPFENRCLDLSPRPTHYVYITEDPKGVLRDVKLNRFPYVLVFEATASEAIVYAVHCTYIDPENKLRKI